MAPKPRVTGTKLQHCQHGSFTIKVGDCVIVNPEKPDARPYVGKVKEIITPVPHADPSAETRLLVTWFYRPEEAVGGRKEFHGEKELFSSDHQDHIAKSTVLARCNVLSLKRYQELPTVGEHDYYSRFMYKPASRTFEPDKVPVFCMCELPYNPDRFMVMCDGCEEWYHPECLRESRDTVERVRSWECPECKLNAANGIKRIRPDVDGAQQFSDGGLGGDQ